MAGESIGNAFIEVKAEADSSFASDLERVAKSSADDIGDSMGIGIGTRLGETLKAVAPAALAGLAVAAGKALYDLGTSFDAMSDTIAVGTGATGEALESLNDVAKNVMASVPASMEDVGQTVADLNTRLGLTGDELEHMSAQFLEASRLMGDVDVNTVTAAFSAFGLEGQAASDAMDDLFTISQATGVGMNELASVVQTNAASMQMLGFSFEESASMVGAFDKAGLNSSQIMASMSRGLVNLAKDGEEPAEAFDRVINELDALVAAGDTAAAIDLASGIFGTKGAVQFVEAMQNGAMNVDELTASLLENDNAIMGTAEATASAAEKFQILGNKVMVAMEPIASAVLDAAGALLDYLLPVVDKVAAAITEAMPYIQGVVTGVMGAIQAVVETVWPIISSIVSDAITTIKTIIEGFQETVALVSGIFENIKTAIENPMETAKNLVKNAIEAIKNFFKFKIQWPHIPLPHFSISGSANPLDWLKGGLPKISVDWYAKGGIVNGATLIGAGEKGPEAIVPLTAPNLAPFADAVAEAIGGRGGIYIENMTVRANDADEFVESMNRQLAVLGAM